MMRKMTILAMLLAWASPAAAQTADDSLEILPLEAQTCNLPSAPARIPEDADYETLVKAKAHVTQFQADMVSYRECLKNAGDFDNLTDGNEIALTQAHNYSVEMEERIAEQFNVAIRAYKARQVEGGQ